MNRNDNTIKETIAMKNSSIILIMTVFGVSGVIAGYDYTISAGYLTSRTVVEQQSLLMTGGGVNIIEAYDYSIIVIQNTAPLELFSGGIWELNMNQNSQLYYLGGEARGVHLSGNATAVFSGGRIDRISSYQYSDGLQHITFICDVDSVSYADNLLTGNWLDGSNFSITLVDRGGYDSVYSNIQFIPEPTTMVLVGMGGLLLRRRK